MMGSPNKTSKLKVIPGGKKNRQVQGSEVKEYVYSKISFNLCENIYEKIDSIVGDAWISSKDYINKYDIIDDLEQLEDAGILLPYNRREELVSLIFEYLETEGYIAEV